MTRVRCVTLRKSYGAHLVLDDVTLDLCGHQIIAIVGANGAGKTTLFQVLTGFERADAGRVWLGDKEVTDFSPHRVSQLGIARSFQELRLIRNISALDNVLLACPPQRGERLWEALLCFGVARGQREARRHAADLLMWAGLDQHPRDLAGSLSYGHQKLLALACCVARAGAVLLLDEPIAGVHPELAEVILGRLAALRQEGRLVVLIEHDLAAVRQIADVVVVMEAGRVIAQGPPVEVLDRPEVVSAFIV